MENSVSCYTIFLHSNESVFIYLLNSSTKFSNFIVAFADDVLGR